MRQLIKELVDWARAFLPPERHRRKYLLPRVPPQESLRTNPGAAAAPTVRAWYEPIDGADVALVRPYLTAYEREETARLQQLRSNTPWFAVYRADPDARDIHHQLEVA
uniref:Uncharacterized protein n=1 Tax=Streptomyces sp. NBC_00093 TaxID=2975649 RepID=A0AAU2A8M9_9ACTN